MIMVEVAPFPGVMYNTKKITDPDKVMSPPYDIISDKMQKELYQKSPYNFVRLILGKQSSTDTEIDNRYTRAQMLWKKWLKQSILIASEKQAIYPYKIEYELDHHVKTMSGFFVLLKLDPDYSSVKAHERTLSKPKADRLNLLRSCQADLEPIQLLYMDEKDSLQKIINDHLQQPLFDIKGYDGFTHKLWKVEDETVLSTVINTLKEKILFIADGHHRYQTAINYAQEQQQKTGKSDDRASYQYKMVILANIFDEGLAILPTHRLLTMKEFNIKKILPKLKQYFTVEENITKDQDAEALGKTIIKDLETETEHKFAFYQKGTYYLLTLKDISIMNDLASDRSETWRTLDVSILHKIILEQILGINESNLEDHIKYTRVDAEAIELVNKGTFTGSFLMNATKIKELQAIAEAGEHMPQKSTYFLPKMLSGLVMYKM